MVTQAARALVMAALSPSTGEREVTSVEVSAHEQAAGHAFRAALSGVARWVMPASFETPRGPDPETVREVFHEEDERVRDEPDREAEESGDGESDSDGGDAV
jgi:hypothetical protein